MTKLNNLTLNLKEPTILPQINENKTLSKLGESGKYYCGGTLNSKCDCCDGSCGMLNGCNCEICMKLDIENRNLPKGWLVNREGFNSKQVNGVFYCGRSLNNLFIKACDPEFNTSCR